ncbi:glutathione S-transferase [Candidatus Uabimicrobium sp. HlEnr_7]|uniref:glutathione S-transferase n=1 Tax=Candidatus Uabimicrobium helgolandensis TaxID=3095367 RepID=UPI003557830D
MITVHHLEHSRSQKILWLLEELEQQYEIVHYKRDKKTNLAPPQLKKIHPLGKSPTVVDGENILAETGAITEYLVSKYNEKNLVPKTGTPEYLKYNYWMHTAEGSIMPLLVMNFIFSRINTQSPFFIRPIAKAITGKVTKAYLSPSLNSMLEMMETELTASTWFTGKEFTAADVQMSGPVEAALAQNFLSKERYPKICEYAERIKQRPSYKKAIEKGGGFIPEK